MRLAILVATLAPYGAENAALRLAQGFKKKGIDVTLILTDCPPAMDTNSIPVIALRQGDPLVIPKTLLYAPLQYVRLRRTCSDHQFDVIISFMERANIFNLTLPKKHKKVLSIRTFLSASLEKDSPTLHRWLIKLTYSLALQRSQYVVCVSRAAAMDMIDTFHLEPHQVRVMQNPLDLEAIDDKAKQPPNPTHGQLLDECSILHVGRFSPDKGQWHLIRAFSNVIESHPNARLIFLGDGDMRPRAEKLTKQLDVAGNVHFLGFQKNPYPFMARCGVFACSSLWEGFPNALVEALCCGAAIVSTDCRSGPRELLAPMTDFRSVAHEIEPAQYGILTPPVDGVFRETGPLTHSESLLAQAICRLLQDEKLRSLYRQIGPQRVEEFHTDRVVDKWMSLINS